MEFCRLINYLAGGFLYQSLSGQAYHTTTQSLKQAPTAPFLQHTAKFKVSVASNVINLRWQVSQSVVGRGFKIKHRRGGRGFVWAFGLMTGRQSGALSAACWATIVAMDEPGYLDATQKIWKPAAPIKKVSRLCLTCICWAIRRGSLLLTRRRSLSNKLLFLQC